MTPDWRHRLWRWLVDLILVLLMVSALVIGLMRLAPGDPLAVLQADARVTPAVRAAWAQTFDSAQSAPAQWLSLWRGLVRGELGWSWSQQRPVIDALRDALPWTALLMGVALTVASLLGLWGGSWLAARAHRPLSRWILRMLRVLAAVPDAWLALLLLLLFAVAWPLLPMQGTCDARRCGDPQAPGWQRAVDVARHAVLPVLTLTLLAVTRFARAQRAAVLPVLHSPLPSAVRARGVPEQPILWRHVVRQALSPWLVMVGVSLPQLVGGAVFVERVYGWPGAGQLLVQAVSARDYGLVLAIALLAAVLTVTGTFAVRVVSAWIDPRVAQPAEHA
jgi:peptide/nickel transport system permease protein